MAAEGTNFLETSVIFLTTAVVAVPISQALGLGSVLGYLLAGMAIGPWGLKLISSPQDILHFSEFGVVLLLFVIGLELNLSRLWKLRKPIFGMGGFQVLATGAVVSLAGLLIGANLSTAIVAGMMFSLSSTAIALQLLKERNQLNTPIGQGSFSVLLFQDLAVIPMMAVLPLLSLQPTESNTDPWISFGKAVLAIGGIVFGGRILIRPIFRFIAASRSREIFTAFALLIVCGIAALMNSVGLSMAMGTFLAGVLLADSEYRHELETDIEPFKGLLMGLFFISVGMTIDFGVVAESLPLISALVLGFLVLKVAILHFVARIFRYTTVESSLFAFSLCQAGEFGFVIADLSVTGKVIPQRTDDVLSAVVAVSMALTPLLMILHQKFLMPWFNKRSAAPDRQPDTIEERENPVLIAGMGRVGGVVFRLLQSKGIKATVLDQDPNQVDMVKRFGFKGYYGDATRLDLLESAGLAQAQVFVLAIDDPEAILRIVELVRHHYPKVKLIARARNRQAAYSLIEKGVDHVIRETFGASLEMGSAALQELGWLPHEARQNTLRFRAHDELMVQNSVQHQHDQDKLISLAKQGRAALEQVMKEDLAEYQKREQHWT